MFRSRKTEKYLDDIVNYLKKQCHFSGGEKLGEYLENRWNDIILKIESISESEIQNVKKCENIVEAITIFEDSVSRLVLEAESKILAELQFIRQNISIDDGDLGKYIEEKFRSILVKETQVMTNTEKVLLEINTIKQCELVLDQKEVEIINKLKSLDELWNVSQKIDELILFGKNTGVQLENIQSNQEIMKTRLEEICRNTTEICSRDEAINIQEIVSNNKMEIIGIRELLDQMIQNYNDNNEKWQARYTNLQTIIKVLIVGESISLIGLVVLLCYMLI